MLFNLAQLALLLFAGVLPSVLARPITVARRTPDASGVHDRHLQEGNVPPHLPFRNYPSEKDDERIEAVRSPVPFVARDEKFDEKDHKHIPFSQYPSEEQTLGREGKLE
ncbi:hypothetical protein MVEN_00938400 [Mycena venus]|uniref:Uncharacterized protein n=1 Tax=Mycena venus TaxID=2733690 RepID=A0A8H6Y861_9AGAR|nr:hypothetical protein MVEN_00938400 [Mycena venus]